MSDGDSIDFLIDRILHACIGHGNTEEFLRGYLRGELEQFRDCVLQEERDAHDSLGEDQ